MDKSDYSAQFVSLLPHPTHPSIYEKSIADIVTGAIRAKSKAIHSVCITNWDADKAAERESRSFLIDVFDEAWYSKLCEPVTFYA